MQGSLFSANQCIISDFGILFYWAYLRCVSTIHDDRYVKLINQLRQVRESKRIRQADLAEKLGEHQSYVSKVEGFERRLDVIELYDWLIALNKEPLEFFRLIGWFTESGNPKDS